MIPVVQEDLEVLDSLQPPLLRLIQKVPQVLLAPDYRPVQPGRARLMGRFLQLNQEFQLLRSVLVRQLLKVQLDLPVRQVLWILQFLQVPGNLAVPAVPVLQQVPESQRCLCCPEFQRSRYRQKVLVAPMVPKVQWLPVSQGVQMGLKLQECLLVPLVR